MPKYRVSGSPGACLVNQCEPMNESLIGRRDRPFRPRGLPLTDKVSNTEGLFDHMQQSAESRLNVRARGCVDV